MLAAACLVVLTATKSDGTGRERRPKDVAASILQPEKHEEPAGIPAARAEDTHILHDSSQCPSHMKGLLFNHIAK